MPKVYYVLVQWTDASSCWGVEFGSYDREDVVAERHDRRDHGVRARDLMILSGSANQASIDAAVAKLNAQSRVTPNDPAIEAEVLADLAASKAVADDVGGEG